MALGPSIFAYVKGSCLMLNITLFRYCACRSYKLAFILFKMSLLSLKLVVNLQNVLENKILKLAIKIFIVKGFDKNILSVKKSQIEKKNR